jgi:hypothetical protein
LASLQEGGLLYSKAVVSWGGGNNWGSVRGWAVGGFGSGVVVADIFQKAVANLVLDGLIVLVVDCNPWDPLVRWGQGVGLDGDGVLHGDGIRTLVAAQDISDVGDLAIGGALVGNTLIISSDIVSLHAVHEIERLEWTLDQVDSASLDEVVLTLSSSVLASEIPTRSGLGLSCVSIWPKVNLSHIKESVSFHCFREGSSNHLLAAWALTLIIEVNFYLVSNLNLLF